MHEFLQELSEKSLSLYDSFTVGESYHPSPEAAREYVKEENNELDTIFNFAHLDSDNFGGAKFFKKPFDLRQFKKGLFDPQRDNYLNGWNTLILENHDNPRCVNRFSIDTKHYRYEAATMLAGITYLGFGTPFIYMGQEAGLVNCDFKNIDEMKDPVSHFVFDLMTSYHMPKKLAFSFIKYGARDHARVPMMWDDSINGGFNKGHTTWQCVNEEYKDINIKKDMEADKSVYRFYQKLLKIKKENETAVYGKLEEYDHDNKKIVAYSRSYENRNFFVVANFAKKKTGYRLPVDIGNALIILSNYERQELGENLELRPYELVVFEY